MRWAWMLSRTPAVHGMRETQLLVSYRGSPVVKDERADTATTLLAAGDRLPDAGQLRRPFVGHALRLRERLGRGRHVLLGLSTMTRRRPRLRKRLIRSA